jgi:hypothetical protein
MRIRKLIAVGAIGAPLLHCVTDLLEWLQGGFSALQLWLNYVAFLPLPAIMIGLYAMQRPQVSLWGLAGAVLYGFAFIYFTFTTQLALVDHVATYADLWNRLGVAYTFHGALMIIGGALFGHASLRAGVLPRWSAGMFLAGLGLNLALTFADVPDLYQTLGTAVRNAGLVGMGWALWRPQVNPDPRVGPSIGGR